jgi:hypothetical protein
LIYTYLDDLLLLVIFILRKKLFQELVSWRPKKLRKFFEENDNNSKKSLHEHSQEFLSEQLVL